MIDLRSDTVTRPTAAMLEAMFAAQVGDDVFEEDPAVAALEAYTAELFGMEAGLFCASGTMTNQIGIRALTQPNDEIICDRLSHIYNYEGGGLASNSLLSVRLLEGDRGRISAEQVVENINPDNIHFPASRLVALENTVNKGGGCYYRLADIAKIHEACRSYGLALHLDGARIFNALVATGERAQDYGQYFDSISVCLSKGLGCPVGSLLLGSRSLIAKAKRIRKVMGGGWRQAGYLAAAGLYALEHHVERLAEDHRRAQQIAELLKDCYFVESLLPVDTNIVLATLKAPYQAEQIAVLLAEAGVRVSTFGKKAIRMVTHLDFSEEALQKLLALLRHLAQPAEQQL